MDTIFNLPLFVLALLQSLLTALHLAGPTALPISQLLKSLRKTPAARAVVATCAVALAVLAGTAFIETWRGADRVHAGDLRGCGVRSRARISARLQLLPRTPALGPQRPAANTPDAVQPQTPPAQPSVFAFPPRRRSEVMATVDFLRAQLSLSLALFNLLALLLNLALSGERTALDFTRKNLAALQKQVGGRP
jgi:hypothetical protein